MNETESIRLQCPHCEKRLRVTAKAAGKRVRCPQCSEPVDVPMQSDVEEESPAPTASRLLWLWVGGGAVFVLLIGLGIWLISGGKKQPEPSGPTQVAAGPTNPSNPVAPAPKKEPEKTGTNPEKPTEPENPPNTPNDAEKNDKKDLDLDLKEPWQKDHIAFARLYFGDDFKRRTTGGGNLFSQKTFDMIKGKRVSWRALVEGNPVGGKSDETVIVAPLSKEATIIIHPLLWSPEAKNKLNSMALGTAVLVSFLLPEDSLYVAPMIANDGTPLILIHVHGVAMTPLKLDESKKSVAVRKPQSSPKEQPRPEGTVPPKAPTPVSPLLKAEMQLWREHTVGKLTLRISAQHEPRKKLDFPNRNYTAKLDELLAREKKDITDGRFALLRLRSQYTPKSVEQGVELTFHLVSDSEDTWPGKSTTFESSIWGVRHIQVKDAIRVLSYDLQLKGGVQEGGTIRGTATGRFRLDIESPWIVFEGAPFELMPWRVEEGKPSPEKNKAAESPDFSNTPGGWPALSGDLNGSYEVRVKNPNEFKVRVGLRSEGKGKDFVVPANQSQSVEVPNGKYDIYFHYSTDPDGLYQGDAFTLKTNGVEIHIVKVVGGNYGIRKVK